MRRRLLVPLGLLFGIACSSSSDGPPKAQEGGAPPDAGLADADLADAVSSVPTSTRPPWDGGAELDVPRVPVTATSLGLKTNVEELMFAAGEMQISGEPFAQTFAGRDLDWYDRTYIPVDLYLVVSSGNPAPLLDLFGFSTAVESYEYSKYHMNMVAQQTGAGVSLVNGPLIARRSEGTPLARTAGRMAELLGAAGADVAGIASVPPPAGNPDNPLGFDGQWPIVAPFRAFDPHIVPADQVVKACNFAGGYGGTPTFGRLTQSYECTYNTLHLPDRDAQTDKTLDPGALGLTTWKEALWSIDFVGRLHDGQNGLVSAIAAKDAPLVGKPNNAVVATSPANAWPGTYLGSTPLEGTWGLTMTEEMDELAEWLTTKLLTKDGKALSGFGTKADALAYDYTSPLAWWPSAIAVTEDKAIPFPSLTSLAITDATSDASDLAALLLGHAMFFAMTDARNAGVGQRIGLTLAFDGAPFARDNGDADGEETAHDRALAVLRVAFVDLDRIHTHPASGILVDSASIAVAAGKATVSPGAYASTTSLAHALIALRQTVLSLNAQVNQYGAADPDPTTDALGILNGHVIHPGRADAGAPPLFSRRVRDVFMQNAAFVRDVLTLPDGRVANGATFDATGHAALDSAATALEAQAAGVRALTEAFLLSGDLAYRDRARLAAQRLEADFFAADPRLYRQTRGGADAIDVTPSRFAWLQSALRETYKSLSDAGSPALSRSHLEARIARINKLFLNGWDDRNGDQTPDPTECLAARLQLGEQALTGELGRNSKGLPVADRDGDCVLEIDDAKSASVLSGGVHFAAP